MTPDKNIFEHRDPLPRRAVGALATLSGEARCLRAGEDASWPAVSVGSTDIITDITTGTTDITTGIEWPATIDACHDLMAIAFGTNNMHDTFERACRAADRRAAARPQDPRLDRLRRLLEDEHVSLERAQHEIMRARPAPEALVEALMYSLRRGIDELAQPDTQRRLAALDESQLEAVCLRVQAFQPNIAPAWSADDAGLLISAWRKFRE